MDRMPSHTCLDEIILVEFRHLPTLSELALPNG
jgi:hypothetical protein